MQQPTQAPAKWQLSQDGLGYLVILSSSSSSSEEEDNNREEVVDARLAIKTETIRIGSSESDCTVCLNNPSINPIHLIININKITYQATLQGIGQTGITLNDQHIQPSTDLIQLNDRDSFNINQFKFRWEQRWDHESIDWDKFKNNSQESSSSILTTIEPASPSKLIIDPNVSLRRKKRKKYVYVDGRFVLSQSDDVQDSEDEEEQSTSESQLSTSSSTDYQQQQQQSQQQQQQPRRKSLLQKLLIKQAVLAHHSDPTIVQSGFSSSEDDEDQEEDRDSSDDDLSTRMTIPTDCSSAKRDAIFKTTTKAKTTDDIIETASPLVSNSRRSISPNAKLFSKYSKNERSLIGDDTSSLISFPLKSSFRKDSYSVDQLSNFSPPPSSSSSSSSSSSKVADSSTVRNNTHFNSKSPSFPINDHDNHPSPNQGVLRNRLRSSLKATTTTTTCTSPTKSEPLPSSSAPVITANLPHRIIRTPRSFLIKRGGSLTPLSAPICGTPICEEQELGLSNHRQDYDFGSIGDSKRKVRFDGDVFCLEFDQLPEELNSNLKRREIKRVKVNDEEVTDSTKIIKRRTTLPLSTTSNSTVRARRHSPRLSTPPLSSAPTATATAIPTDESDGVDRSTLGIESIVDFSGLSISHSAVDLDERVEPIQEKRRRRRGSMFDTINTRLFPDPTIARRNEGETTIACIEARGGRRMSLPSDDIGRLTELIQARLVHLKLTTKDQSVTGIHRTHSDPNPIRPSSRPLSFPLPSTTTTFSPSLVGVKELLMAPLDGIHAFFKGIRNTRSTPLDDCLSSDSDDDDDNHDHAVKDGEKDDVVVDIDGEKDEDNDQSNVKRDKEESGIESIGESLNEKKSSSDEGVPTIPSASVPLLSSPVLPSNEPEVTVPVTRRPPGRPRKLKITTIDQNQSVEPSGNLSSLPSSEPDPTSAQERGATDELSSSTATHNRKKITHKSADLCLSSAPSYPTTPTSLLTVSSSSSTGIRYSGRTLRPRNKK
ncbi:hypothetical protein MJO28_012907 [Puccinia striiformis f. sp. tritici]|uniref:Uncharacterized protein n=1 Tax=Puccinia striiformis f. sp. tritici TaxID=168172 RepID=A0ACC0DWU1_9BASI|nr:hypothetical protein MJO28_012907 [Puccinia striiformis f. sp. tritici]